MMWYGRIILGIFVVIWAWTTWDALSRTNPKPATSPSPVQPTQLKPVPKESSIDQSMRMEGFHQLGITPKGMDMKVVMDVESYDDCHKLCENESDFDCQVHEYHGSYKMCTLGTKSDLRFVDERPESPYKAYNSDIIEISEFDEFDKHPDHVPRFNKGVVKTSHDNVLNLNSCYVSCLTDHGCGSFTWNTNTQTCTQFDRKVALENLVPAFSTHVYIRK